jgi:hypothetical protein
VIKRFVFHFLIIFIFSSPIDSVIPQDTNRDHKWGFWWWATSIKKEKFFRMLEYAPQHVFIKAGRFLFENNQYKFIPIKIPNDFKLIKTNTEFHLVFTHEFSKEENKGIYFGKYLKGAVIRSINYFKKYNFNPSGIQFNFEGKFDGANLKNSLHNLQKTVIRKNGLKISTAIYPTELGSVNISSHIKDFDFLCIMFYDYSFKFKNYKLTDAEWINSYMKKLSMLKKPFYIGLPLYGIISVFNEKKELVFPQIFLSSKDFFDKRNMVLIPNKKNKQYRVIKDFQYKNITLKKNWFVMIYEPSKDFIIKILQNINFNYPYSKGIVYFPFPIKEINFISDDDLNEVIGFTNTILE